LKRILITLILCALVLSPALAGITMEAQVSVAALAVPSVDAAGHRSYNFEPYPISGLAFCKRGSSGMGVCASVDLGVVPTEAGGVNMAPAVALHLGTRDTQFFVGAAYAPDGDPHRQIAPMFGIVIGGKPIGQP